MEMGGAGLGNGVREGGGLKEDVGRLQGGGRWRLIEEGVSVRIRGPWEQTKTG